LLLTSSTALETTSILCRHRRQNYYCARRGQPLPPPPSQNIFCPKLPHLSPVSFSQDFIAVIIFGDIAQIRSSCHFLTRYEALVASSQGMKLLSLPHKV
jgi:hypothetical protein